MKQWYALYVTLYMFLQVIQIFRMSRIFFKVCGGGPPNYSFYLQWFSAYTTSVVLQESSLFEKEAYTFAMERNYIKPFNLASHYNEYRLPSRFPDISIVTGN